MSVFLISSGPLVLDLIFTPLIIWGTMTLVIFITNAPSCYFAGGGLKKVCPRARRILIKNFKNLFKFFSRKMMRARARVSRTLTTCNALKTGT